MKVCWQKRIAYLEEQFLKAEIAMQDRPWSASDQRYYVSARQELEQARREASAEEETVGTAP